MLVKSEEMTGRSQTLPWWPGGKGVKKAENKRHLFRWGRVFGLVYERPLMKSEVIYNVRDTGGLALNSDFFSSS